jgi:hypothetical protein
VEVFDLVYTLLGTASEDNTILISVAAGTFTDPFHSSGRCLETNVVSEPVTSNGRFFGSTALGLSKDATIFKN